MANLQKYKLGAVGHMFNHYERRTGENVKRGNEDINKERTHLNYNLHTGETADGERHAPTQNELLNKRLSEIQHVDLKKRKDINVMCDWVITLPADVPPERAREFFQNSYDFLCKRYGKENVLSAWVHLDETTPHLHFCFVPVVKNEDGTERLCAKEVIDKKELSRFHTDLQKDLEAKMQTKVGVLNGATIGGNLTIYELKLKELLKEVATAKAETAALGELLPLIATVKETSEGLIAAFKDIDESLKKQKFSFKGKTTQRLEAAENSLDTLNKKIGELADINASIMKTFGDDLDKQLRDSIQAEMNAAKEQAERRVKREWNKIKRESKKQEEMTTKLIEKEQSISAQIEQGIADGLKQHEDEIRQKMMIAADLDKEIQLKRAQSKELDADFWAADFLQKGLQNQNAFMETLKKWGLEK